jgi:hypothetical protein
MPVEWGRLGTVESAAHLEGTSSETYEGEMPSSGPGITFCDRLRICWHSCKFSCGSAYVKFSAMRPEKGKPCCTESAGK